MRFSQILENNGDTVAYPIQINEDDNYNFDLLYKKEDAGKKLKIRIDDNDYIIATLPHVKATDSEYIKTTIFNETLSKGIHTLALTCIDKIEMNELSFTQTNLDDTAYSYDLLKEEDLNYISDWLINENGHIAKATDRNIAYIPLENIDNAVIEVDVSIYNLTGVDAAVGLVLRAKNAGLYTTEDQTGIQGYFCGVNSYSAFISKYNFEYSEKNLCYERSLLKVNETYHLKVTIKGNNIVYDFNNGKIIMEYNDPIKYSSGNFGIYADNVTAAFTNLKVTPII